MRSIAVNICDLSECFTSPGLAGMLLADFVRHDVAYAVVQPVSGRIDTGAVLLNGPAIEDPKRLAALVSLLQTVLGPRKIGRRVRCYQQGPRGGWKEIIPRQEVTHATIDTD